MLGTYLYVREGCPMCHRAEQLLREQGKEYRRHRMDDDNPFVLIGMAAALGGKTFVPLLLDAGKLYLLHAEEDRFVEHGRMHLRESA